MNDIPNKPTEQEMESVISFKDGYGSGDGAGSGYGAGDGYAYETGAGDGSGDGAGYETGSGDDVGDGAGYGVGYGDGYGSGYADGYADGDGNRDGSGDGARLERELAEARSALRDMETVIDESLRVTNAAELWALWRSSLQIKVLDTHAAAIKAAWETKP